jgi:hypothetical protein
MPINFDRLNTLIAEAGADIAAIDWLMDEASTEIEALPQKRERQPEIRFTST